MEYPQNERRKDKELTERITKILKIRDDLMKEADIREFVHFLGTTLHIAEGCTREGGNGCRPSGMQIRQCSVLYVFYSIALTPDSSSSS